MRAQPGLWIHAIRTRKACLKLAQSTLLDADAIVFDHHLKFLLILVVGCEYLNYATIS